MSDEKIEFVVSDKLTSDLAMMQIWLDALDIYAEDLSFRELNGAFLWFTERLNKRAEEIKNKELSSLNIDEAVAIK